MTHRAFRLVLVLSLSSCSLLSASAADKPTKADLVKAGKAATALVDVDKHGTGSAFCVHKTGLFVTNEHVVTGAEGKEVKLVLDASLPSQRILKAKVVRVDKKLDLALLRAEEPGELTALPLGSTADIVELTDVIAFGFPFGRALSTDKGEYPAISVNAGTVTAIRLKAKEIDRIQLDVALNPGNSGGAVIDDRGRVLGVVVSGAVAARINFAIPVGHLEGFLKAPDLAFQPPALTPENCRQAGRIQSPAVSVMPNAAEPSLKLILRAGEGPAQRVRDEEDGHEWVAHDDRRWPQPANQAGRDHREVRDSTITGTMDDAVFKVGDKPRSTQRRATDRRSPTRNPLVTLADGKTTMARRHRGDWGRWKSISPGRS